MDRTAGNSGVWSVAQAKTHLSTILRLAESDGPQVIGFSPTVRGLAVEGLAGTAPRP